MDVFKKQVTEWRKQREQARMNFRQLWSDYGDVFCEWWENGCSNEIRLALILTSKDDILTNSSPDENAVALLASLIDSLFPEINALIISSQKEEKEDIVMEDKKEKEKEEEDIESKKEEEDDDEEEKLFKLGMCEFMKLAFDKRDIETELFSITSLRDAMEREDADALLVARGSLILQFCLSVMLMFTSQLNEPDQ